MAYRPPDAGETSKTTAHDIPHTRVRTSVSLASSTARTITRSAGALCRVCGRWWSCCRKSVRHAAGEGKSTSMRLRKAGGSATRCAKHADGATSGDQSAPRLAESTGASQDKRTRKVFSRQRWRVGELVSNLIRNQAPLMGLRVRVPCPPLPAEAAVPHQGRRLPLFGDTTQWQSKSTWIKKGWSHGSWAVNAYP